MEVEIASLELGLLFGSSPITEARIRARLDELRATVRQVVPTTPERLKPAQEHRRPPSVRSRLPMPRDRVERAVVAAYDAARPTGPLPAYQRAIDSYRSLVADLALNEAYLRQQAVEIVIKWRLKDLANLVDNLR